MDLGLEHAIEWWSRHVIECRERLESREQEKIPENQQSESQSQNTVQVGKTESETIALQVHAETIGKKA